MKSTIAEALKLEFEPVALVWSDTVPNGAVEFKAGKSGCIMWMLSRAVRVHDRRHRRGYPNPAVVMDACRACSCFFNARRAVAF
ncbi:MAG: DUF169 domain-containing protein [Desulfobacterales bacterium]|nr:DUF169 domain-containing protein [Desulfobacterales bacterium]